MGREVFRYTSRFALAVIGVPVPVRRIFAPGGTCVSPAPRRKWVQGCRFCSGNQGAAKPHLRGRNLGVREPCQPRHHRRATPSYLTTELAWHQDDGLLPSGSLPTQCVIPTSSLQRQRPGAKGKPFPIWGAFHCLSVEASRREVKLLGGHPSARITPPLASFHRGWWTTTMRLAAIHLLRCESTHSYSFNQSLMLISVYLLSYLLVIYKITEQEPSWISPDSCYSAWEMLGWIPTVREKPLQKPKASRDQLLESLRSIYLP